MPEIGRIQSTNFQALLTELGIVRNDVPFALRSEVSPVVLVGGTVSFIAPATPPYGVTDVFTAGVVVAPIAGAVLADTGPLPVGAYTVQTWVFAGESNRMNFQWRDAPNTATLREWRFEVGTFPRPPLIWTFRLDVLNANERFRVITGVGTAAIEYQASISAKI